MNGRCQAPKERYACRGANAPLASVRGVTPQEVPCEPEEADINFLYCDHLSKFFVPLFCHIKNQIDALLVKLTTYKLSDN